MNISIHETTPELFSLLNVCSVHFIKDNMIRARLCWDCWEASLDLQDVTNAGISGKTCPSVTVKFRHAEHNGSDGINAMMAFLAVRGDDLRKTWADVVAMDWPKSDFFTPSITDGSTTYHLHMEKAVRVYSPFAVYNPLKAAPAKWTVAHVIRALWNGQFEGLKCDNQFTDDYAFDAAANFGRGQIRDGRAFASKLIESPSGWWAHGPSADGAEVSICCHTFDCNSFKFRVDGVQSVAPVAAVA
jgi:hypothetical protein